jgi:hypothetical protein
LAFVRDVRFLQFMPRRPFDRRHFVDEDDAKVVLSRWPPKLSIASLPFISTTAVARA